MRRAAFLLGACLLLHAKFAWADKVLVLPFRPTDRAMSTLETTQLARSTAASVVDRGHSLASEPERSAAEKTLRDGTFDTQAEFLTAGKAAQAVWTISARVEPKGMHYGLELEVCQVSSGRVESVAREIQSDLAIKQIGEMLALLLRPEGLNGAAIPWEKSGPPPLLVPPAPAKSDSPTPVPPASPPPSAMPAMDPPPRVYAEGVPFAVGASVGVLTAFARPAGARGNATSLLLEAKFAYAIEQAPGLEIGGDVGGGLVGPSSVFLDAGARYAFLFFRPARMYFGPAGALGAFVPIAGDKSARFLIRGGVFAGLELAKNFSVELGADAFVAPGGTGNLSLFSAAARGLARF